jgi:hypothetical protein
VVFTPFTTQNTTSCPLLGLFDFASKENDKVSRLKRELKLQNNSTRIKTNEFKVNTIPVKLCLTIFDVAHSNQAAFDFYANTISLVNWGSMFRRRIAQLLLAFQALFLTGPALSSVINCQVPIRSFFQSCDRPGGIFSKFVLFVQISSAKMQLIVPSI